MSGRAEAKSEVPALGAPPSEAGRPTAPGAHRPTVDLNGSFVSLARKLPPGAIVIIDRKVARLHPQVLAAIRPRAAVVIPLPAGEPTKSTPVLEKLAARTLTVPRTTTVLAIGGGTIGDLATVFAHLFKRGVPLIHVPSTLLAAVDSSLGGKGAVHAGTGRALVKNALGVFHYCHQRWICPELFGTLSARQHREGLAEAYKMALTLDATRWTRYAARTPALKALLADSRELKDAVCAQDPYEQSGLRRVLNFGHTFGHVIETVSGFRVSHGEAVGLGMRCALEVGVEMGITPLPLARSTEEALTTRAGILPRSALRRIFSRTSPAQVARVLSADKKNAAAGQLKMVLLEGPGSTTVADVPLPVWRALLLRWRG